MSAFVNKCVELIKIVDRKSEIFQGDLENGRSISYKIIESI